MEWTVDFDTAFKCKAIYLVRILQGNAPEKLKLYKIVFLLHNIWELWNYKLRHVPSYHSA